jgi:hypothetical protein
LIFIWEEKEVYEGEKLCQKNKACTEPEKTLEE